jgi:hypothetical protein
MVLDTSQRPRAALWIDNTGIGTQTLSYATCTGDCGATDWSFPIIDALPIGEVRPTLLLDDDRPRLAWTDSLQIYFASCDAGCGNDANWTTTYVRDGGHGGFVIGPDGAYWLASCSLPGVGAFLGVSKCTSGCTESSNWTTELLDQQCTRVHDMTIDDDGRMSILYGRFIMVGGTFAFEHVSCSSGDCLTDTNWATEIEIGNTGFDDPGGDLAIFGERGVALLDNDTRDLRRCTDCGPALPPVTYTVPADDMVSQGRIEVTGAGALGLLTDGVSGDLTYQVCESGCDAAGGWRAASGLPEADDAFDLELLPSGLPAVLSGGGASAPGDLVYSVGRPQ